MSLGLDKNKKFYPWLIVALLWVVALLNYMDRQMLSTMQGAIKADIAELQKDVWGGFCASGESSEVHTDGYCLDTGSGVWTRLEPPRSADGRAMTLTGGRAWTEPGGRLLATGGVCRDIFLDAISSRYTLVSRADYLSQPIEWYRFSGYLYEYDTVCGKWLATTFASRLLARAGAQAVATPYGTYYIGGELKPALRTPQIVLVYSR